MCFTVGQTSEDDALPPEMLVRLRTIFGWGAIHGWRRSTRAKDGKPHRKPWHFRFGGFAHVQASVAMLWPWLTPEKKDQAEKAFARYHTLTRKAA